LTFKSDWLAGNTGHIAAHNAIGVRLNRVVHVTDYGAIGDGTTDDTAAIQNAINSCVNGVVMLGACDYLISGSISITSPITLQGCGRSTRLLKGSGLTTLTVDSNYGAGEGIRLADFQIRGKLGTETGQALVVNDTSLLNLSRVKVSNVADNAVIIRGAWDCSFYDLFIEECGSSVDATIPAALLGYTVNGRNDHLMFYNLHIEGCQGIHLKVDSDSAQLMGLYCFGIKLHHRQIIAPPEQPLLVLTSNAAGAYFHGGLVGWGKGHQIEVAGSYNLFENIQFGGNGLDDGAITYPFHFLNGAQRNVMLHVIWSPGACATGLVLYDSGALDNELYAPKSGSLSTKVLFTDNDGRNFYDYIKPDDHVRYRV